MSAMPASGLETRNFLFTDGRVQTYRNLSMADSRMVAVPYEPNSPNPSNVAGYLPADD